VGVGLGGASIVSLILALAGLLIRSLFRAAKNDEEYRQELKERDAARAAELSRQREEWEQEKRAWREDRDRWVRTEESLRRRMFELEANVKAQKVLIDQLTANRGTA
jgi:hypothetical protein